MPVFLQMFLGVGISEITTATAQLGLSIALCVFFVWHNAKQQARSDAKVDELELFIRTTLVDQIHETQTVMRACQDAIDNSNRRANSA